MYLDFACCAAVPGGGRNREYAMHLLHMYGGNIHVSANIITANFLILILVANLLVKEYKRTFLTI